MKPAAADVTAPSPSPRVVEFYEHLVRALPWGMAVLHLRDPKDAGTWRLVSVNTRAKLLIGREIDDYLKPPIRSLDEIANVDAIETIRAAYKQRRMKQLGHVVDPTRFCPSLIYAVDARPLEDNCVAITLHDVTTAVQTRRERTRAEWRLEQICRSARAILWTADPGTLQFRSVTDEARTILGFWLERWTDEPNFLRNHCYPEDWELMRARCAELARDERTEPFDFRMYDIHGKIHWFRMNLSMGMGMGLGMAVEPGALLCGVMVDVTDQKENEEAARELSARVMRAQEKERKRISRDLHDSVGQYLTGLHWSLARLRRNEEAPEKLREQLAECARTVQVCMEEVRSVAYALHPPAIDMLGLGPAIEWQAKRFAEQSGLKVHVQLAEGIGRLEPEAEIALFRVFQECLSNVRRHAKTDEAFVWLRCDGAEMELEVKDRGVGVPAELLKRPAPGRGGIGLLKMRERVEDLGGSLEVRSNGSGTLVRARIPRPQPPATERAAAEPAQTTRPRRTATR
jgi:signal transduction histidine kinase